jgi:hypothetical protein
MKKKILYGCLIVAVLVFVYWLGGYESKADKMTIGDLTQNVNTPVNNSATGGTGGAANASVQPPAVEPKPAEPAENKPVKVKAHIRIIMPQN